MAPLLEAVAFGRVHVLGLQRIVLAQPARLEAEHAPARVCERKDDALREVVVATAVDEPGREQFVVGELALASLLREACARQARTRAGTRGRSPRRVRARPGTRARLRHRSIPRGSVRRTPSPRRAARRGGRGGDARPRCAVTSPRTRARPGSGRRATRPRRRSRGSPRLLDERDQVTARSAAEAVVELVDRVDGVEARRPLLVERAPACVARAGLAELGARADHVQHVPGRLHGLDRLGLDPRHEDSG